MTTSLFNAPVETTQQEPEKAEAPPSGRLRTSKRTRTEPTFASRFIFLIICSAIVLSTLAFGTVHYWALAVFELGAAIIVCLWCADAWQSGSLRISRNLLQLPLLGLILLGLIQLLPFGPVPFDKSLLSFSPYNSLSLDPYSTRLVVVQLASLFIYFAATLAFVDSPARLRTIVRTIIIFGFILAIFGLIQAFTSPTKVYWIRDLPQSTPFGPFINRHHFAGYMELTLALPLGMLFSGAVEREKRFLFIFVTAVMGIALIMTNSRGGIISFVAEVIFLSLISSVWRNRTKSRSNEKDSIFKSPAVRVLLGFGLVVCLLLGVVMLGGESVLNRFVGTVSSSDPTTGRAHFWSVALDVIADHPIIGAGLGSFGLAYTRYDTRNGLLRLEQAHNDYLQILSDAGIIGGLLGLFFIIVLFRRGFLRTNSADIFRNGVAIGALAGCFAVLVHSFFDFTLHTTSNALLFLVFAALATLGSGVEFKPEHRRHHHHHRSGAQPLAAGVEPRELES